MTGDQPLACARVRILLEAYADGYLAEDDPTLASAVRRHLAGCADCRRQPEQAISLPFRLRALSSRRAWTLLLPEAILSTFILWYLSGLDGLTSIASGIFGDLLGLAGWGSGAGPLPTVPRVDVVLLVALIALTAIAGYHLSILIRLTPGPLTGRRTARE